MSSSNCCFLTCIQVSQEACKVVWYSHLFKNFPQFVVNFFSKEITETYVTLHLSHSKFSQSCICLTISCPTRMPVYFWKGQFLINVYILTANLVSGRVNKCWVYLLVDDLAITCKMQVICCLYTFPVCILLEWKQLFRKVYQFHVNAEFCYLCAPLITIHIMKCSLVMAKGLA